MDIEEIVVKKMSQHLKNVGCFMGITFIGQGALALILDLISIAEISNITTLTHSEQKYEVKSISEECPIEYMQFNLKQSSNYAFPLNLVNRLEEIETQSVEFCGAIPLVRYRGEVMPLLFIERQLKMCSAKESLNDFYPSILKVIVVNFNGGSVGIVVDEILDIGISSRPLDVHTNDREEFLGTIFLSDKIVTIVDIPLLIKNYIKFEQDLIKKDEDDQIRNGKEWKNYEAA